MSAGSVTTALSHASSPTCPDARPPPRVETSATTSPASSTRQDAAMDPAHLGLFPWDSPSGRRRGAVRMPGSQRPGDAPGVLDDVASPELFSCDDHVGT